jgi:CheY-like chemotaxis protein
MNSKYTILLVEDDNVDCLLFSKHCNQIGLNNKIVRARHGEEALQLLENTHDTLVLKEPYIIISDMRMPRMNGDTLLRVIRSKEELKHTKFYLCSTHLSEGTMKTLEKLNIDGYTLKDDLRAFLKELKSNQRIKDVA